MTTDWQEVAHLLELAQAGGAAEALAESERLLSAATGSVADGPAALHFPRAVALLMLADHKGALAACELLLAAADREGSRGWRSIALSTRSSFRLSVGDLVPAEADPDSALRDAVEAEAVLALAGEDQSLAEHAHTGIALAYDQLRLFELALPHYEAAYEASRGAATGRGGPAMWQCNLAEFHLGWALELYRVGLDSEAEAQSRLALEHARRAGEVATGPQAAAWRADAELLAACARADGPDPREAADEISRVLERRAARGQRHELIVYPFLAVALDRSGRPKEAIETIETGLAALERDPGDSPWLMRAALRHTQAVLLARTGPPEVAVTLQYGNELAQALWRQRERTLHYAKTLQRYETLRAEHEAMSLSAETDALTGVANRRGLDRTVAHLQARVPSTAVGVLVIDLDKFKATNDTRGHSGGDEALRSVAGTLTWCAREGDVVARLGGDEFAVLLPGAGPAAAAQVAERIREGVRGNPACGGTVSVGVASGASTLLPDLLEAADHAMYAAKRAGGDAVMPSGDSPG